MKLKNGGETTIFESYGGRLHFEKYGNPRFGGENVSFQSLKTLVKDEMLVSKTKGGEK